LLINIKKILIIKLSKNKEQEEYLVSICRDKVVGVNFEYEKGR